MLQLRDSTRSILGPSDDLPPWAPVSSESAATPLGGAPVPLALDRVSLRRGTTMILDDISLTVRTGDRWLLLGPNGSGKSSLLRVAALYEHPTTGTVEVLGERLGRTDVRELRRRIGYSSAALAEQLRPGLRVLDVVRTARFAALEPWWHRYTPADDRRALECLERMGVAGFAEREFGTLSSGERQRALLARTLMNEPAVVLLDEPSARLDLAGREQLVAALDELAGDPHSPPLVFVTHHVDDVPTTMTHTILLRSGRVLARGPIGDVLDAGTLSACFGLDLCLERRPDGRLGAWAS
jgi:iron complex transport system ATP-binding protein